MNRDDWVVVGDKCVVLFCCVVIVLYAVGAIG